MPNPGLAPSKSAMLLKPQGPKPPLSWRMLASTTSRRRRILPCASGCADRRWSEPTDHVNGLEKRLERKNSRLTSRRSQPPLALAVPLSRFPSRVGGGSAFYVRRRDSPLPALSNCYEKIFQGRKRIHPN